MAGREANVFMNQEGRFHLRTREVWQRFSGGLLLHLFENASRRVRCVA